MVGKLAGRSGFAVVNLLEWIGFSPDVMFHVGIGEKFPECKILRSEHPNVQFFGVEPNRRSYALAKTEYPGELENVALSNYRGIGKLWIRPRHADGSSMFKPRNHISDFQMVDVTTIDQLWGKKIDKRKKNLLWLDCEGSEWNVLIDSKKFLDSIGVINLEMTSRPFTDEDWADPVELHELLIEFGFVRQWAHSPRSLAGQIDAVYVKRKLFKPEYCCCPCEIKRCGE